MDDPIWVSASTVEAMHARLLAEHGGLPGVREPGGMDSAMARPKQLFAYGEPAPDLAALATCYAGGFIRNHPFVDGNKRMGFAVAITFLRLNGWTVAVGQAEAHQATVALATREISEIEFAAWIRSNLTPWSRRFR